MNHYVIHIFMTFLTVYLLLVPVFSSNSATENCIEYTSRKLQDAYPGLFRNKLQKHDECPLSNYVCNVKVLANNTTIVSSEIPFFNTKRLLLDCKKNGEIGSELQMAYLGRFEKLTSLGFSNCHFNNWEMIGQILRYAPSRHLMVMNSTFVADNSSRFIGYVHNHSDLESADLARNGLSTVSPELICTWNDLFDLALNHNLISDLSFLFQQCLVRINQTETNHVVSLQTLAYLDISNNLIAEVSKDFLTAFPVLRVLDLHSNNIHTIGVQFGSSHEHKVSSIWKLDLSQNNLQQFGECHMFPHVIQLNLSGNPIQCSEGHLKLQDCGKLAVVQLNNIQAQECNVGTSLSLVPQLTELTISGTPLKTLDFSTIPRQAMVINACNSHIHTLSDLSNVSSLLAFEHLNVERNELEDLTNFSFPPSLLAVDLKYNKIEKIDSKIFEYSLGLAIVYLEHNKLKDFCGLFNHLPNLTELYLQDNNIVYFDYSIIPHSLITLNISQNSITEITDDHHVKDEKNIHELDISNNHFITLTDDSFSHSLQYIHMNNAEVDSCHSGALETSKRVYIITMYNTVVHHTKLPLFLNHTGTHSFMAATTDNCKQENFTCFCECDSIPAKSSIETCCHTYNSSSYLIQQHFFFNKNLGKFTYCLAESSCFNLCGRMQFVGYSKQYKSLKQLHCTKRPDFSIDSIHTSPEERQAKYLKSRGLMLNHMSILALSDRAFEDFHNLVILYLDKNFIENIQENALKGLGKLSKLYLNNNKIVSISDHSFKDLQNLVTLHLSDNLLKMLNRSTFFGLTSMTRLHLNANHLRSIADESFADLKSLQYLYLQANDIYEVRQATFSGLNNLFELDLQANKIGVIHGFSFKYMNRLKILHLGENRIKTIDATTLRGLSHIRTLNLSSNQLSYIATGSFVHLLSMKCLFLHENRLSNWSVVVPPQVENLTFSNNQFPCDCESVLQLQKELRIISHAMQTDAEKNRCYLKNAYSNLINYITEENCYNRSVAAHDNGSSSVIIASVVPVVIFLLMSCVIIALYVYRLEAQIILYFKFNVRLWKHEEDKDIGKAFHAFLAYNDNDRVFIQEHLLSKLEERFRVCVHERDFPAGAYIIDTIADTVETSCRTLVILSPAFAQSEWCLLEFRYAHYQALKDKCCRLIVILIEDVDQENLSGELRAYLRTNTFLRWGDPLFWQKLIYAMPVIERSESTRL